jgi:hypothetical protein
LDLNQKLLEQGIVTHAGDGSLWNDLKQALITVQCTPPAEAALRRPGGLVKLCS